jgi:hypothetical protein
LVLWTNKNLATLLPPFQFLIFYSKENSEKDSGTKFTKAYEAAVVSRLGHALGKTRVARFFLVQHIKELIYRKTIRYTKWP